MLQVLQVCEICGSDNLSLNFGGAHGWRCNNCQNMVKGSEMGLYYPHYSGKKSEEFWDQINHLPDEAYTLGCIIQNIEEDILKRLNDIIRDQHSPKHKYKCSKCGQILERNSDKKWLKSYCSVTKQDARIYLQEKETKK